MSTELAEMGPIDFMVIEFPGGRMSGEGLPLLVDLADRGIVRVLDLVFARKLSDGSVVQMNMAGLSRDGVEGLEVFEGASSGMLDDRDISAAASVIESGSTAALLVYENRWAAQEQPPYQQQPAEYAQPAQTAAASPDQLAQLRELAALKDQGVLTDAEFASQKQKVLAG